MTLRRRWSRYPTITNRACTHLRAQNLGGASQIRNKRPSVHLSRAICPSIKRSSARLRDGMKECRRLCFIKILHGAITRGGYERDARARVCTYVYMYVFVRRVRSRICGNSGVSFTRGSQTTSSVGRFVRARTGEHKSASSALSANNLPPIARLGRYVNVVPRFPTAVRPRGKMLMNPARRNRAR